MFVSVNYKLPASRHLHLIMCNITYVVSYHICSLCCYILHMYFMLLHITYVVYVVTFHREIIVKDKKILVSQ